MKHLLRSLPVYLLIILFVYAPVSKLLAPGEFLGQLYNQPFPHWAADVLFYALPLIELLAVGLLLSERFRLAGLWLSTGMMLAFTGYVGTVLLHAWPRVPCSCGGILNRMSWRAHFAFNLAFLLVCATGLLLTYSSRPKPRFRLSRIS
ncbi:MauE/DoxX family redox-associated membrane protein [Mucilaginibacter agri]|uniref:Methylamine utilisation protein MauE domain-containing protein n=1 Tax=Mucilaginibacter agri TaxID=2695265 RepID=A0A965ZE82_9SPHI|nr:MauE/DoxX family redox-associated membrane protein [Mucilaginibacter agri]NCD69095.1 hypothetical protein [Mucilaginibacter agri]